MHRYGLYALQWIVEVNGKPTPNLDAFVNVTKVHATSPVFFLCPCRSLTNFFPEDLVILYVFYLKNAFTHGQLHIYLFLEHIKRDATYELAIIPEFSSI